MNARVGLGVDIHPFSDDPSRLLVLGGVEFAGSRGLEGHSDADVVAHAVADALLGAAGLGDIGTLFPATAPEWEGADSLAMLRHVAQLVRDAGWAVANVDCSVIAESPRLGPHVATMGERLSAAAGGAVTVKPKRAEGIGALGRGEGIVCHAVALLAKDAP